LTISTASREVRLIDLVIRNNAGTSNPGGLSVSNAKVAIVNCTFLENTTASAQAQQIVLTSGTVTITNTVVYGASSGTMLYKPSSGLTLTTTYDLVKGMTLTGTGNLAGTTDPLLRSDGRLLPGSPLRAAGGATGQSALDIDLEARPGTPDIGADQFVDSDSDSLADSWEAAEAGSLSTLTGLTQDPDSDGLSNQNEYLRLTRPTAADTDGDGLSDGQEVNTQGTDPLSADTDGDAMPDGWEVTSNLNPLIANGLDDADGDRYPNVFEYARSTNPQSASSTPTPDLIVDPALGGASSTDNIYTTCDTAFSVSTPAAGGYQIVEIRPAVYIGPGNTGISVRVTSNLTRLAIGSAGAARTVIDGRGYDAGWSVGAGTAVLASLTIRRTTGALKLLSSSGRLRLVDALILENSTPDSTAGAIEATSMNSLHVMGSSLLNNTSKFGAAQQVRLVNGSAAFANSVVWGASPNAAFYKAAGVNLSASYSLVKGMTLGGTGNLPGTVDPLLRLDARVLSSSPLRAAGGLVATSLQDIDLEARPNPPDIGADQWRDADSDGLPDGWELLYSTSLATLSGGDADADGLADLAEYAWFDGKLGANPLNPDTDGDQVRDGDEVLFGTSPLVCDSDDLGGDANHDGVIDALGIQLGYLTNNGDDDGDSITNANELLLGTDPLRPDTDGDGVADNLDAFPNDPLRSALGSDISDTTAPVITLSLPSSAVLQ